MPVPRKIEINVENFSQEDQEAMMEAKDRGDHEAMRKIIMKYLPYGEESVARVIELDAKKLSKDECADVQIKGFRICPECGKAETHWCNGENIRKTGRNALGYEVPIGEESYRAPDEPDEHKRKVEG